MSVRVVQKRQVNFLICNSAKKSQLVKNMSGTKPNYSNHILSSDPATQVNAHIKTPIINKTLNTSYFTEVLRSLPLLDFVKK